MRWLQLVPLPDPQVWKSVVGPRTFATVQELLWYICSPVCGLSFWWLYGEFNGDLLEEGLRHIQVCCTQSPHPWVRPLLTHTSAGGSSGSVSCGVPGSWCAQGFVWAFRASLVSMGFDSKCNFAPPTNLLGLFLCPWTWGIFLVGSNILLSMVVQQLVASLEFSQKTGACASTLPSWSLLHLVVRFCF